MLILKDLITLRALNYIFNSAGYQHEQKFQSDDHWQHRHGRQRIGEVFIE